MKIISTYIAALLLIVLLAACDDDKPSKTELPIIDYAFVLTSDYTTGSFSLIDLNSYKTFENPTPGYVHADASVRIFNNIVYIINRAGRDSIQVLDPKKNHEIVTEFSTGTSSNPQDIAIYRDTSGKNKAYVSVYGNSKLLVVNPETGKKSGSIDLSSYSAAGMNHPHMCMMHVHENLLFVALQRLDSSFKVSNYSSVVVIDAEQDIVIKEIRLSWTENDETVNALNPYSRFKIAPDYINNSGKELIYISCPGEFGYFYKEDGGVVAIDPETLECLPGYLVSESDLNTEITDFQFGPDQKLYILTSSSDFRSNLLLYDLQNESVSKTILSNKGTNGNLCSLSLHTANLLFVSDRTATNPGIHIIDISEDPKHLFDGKPLNTGLPPVMVDFNISPGRNIR
ncbi:MAG TPA: hypothetical protein P5123_02745 [Spirochaetota bacterium]|nr:hypothetical protein [Spirochaetota bacterium]